MYISEITHGELRVERVNDGIEEGGGVGGEKDVINVQQQVCNGCTTMKDEERRITLRCRKTNRGNEGGEAMKLCTRHLFKPIKRFIQATTMRWMRGVKEAIGLLTVDGLLEMTMEEGIFDIQLVN
jgi:hypothetical protein